MTLWPSSVVVAGATIPLAEVLADVTIHHGRDDIFGEPTASTCQVTFLEVDRAFARAFQVGGSLVLNVRDGAGPITPRFTGKITDAALEDTSLTVIAVARLSSFGQYTVGAGAWPAETWSARMTRIFTEAGLNSLLDFYPDPDFNPQLAARTADPTTLDAYLSELVPMVGAAVTDQGNGRIRVQAIGARSLASPVAVNPADVAYALNWEQVLPGGNSVTVRYLADQSASVTLTEPTSISVYGTRPLSLDTTFSLEADASYRANELLVRGAFPHWNIRECPILRGLSTLQIGSAIRLEPTPPAAPFDPWTPFVEGWEDQISGDEWVMRVALSDPLASGLVLPWNSVPADIAWNEVDPATSWSEALSLDDLIPGR